ncbi:MAG: CHRD domain-containing protein [Gammaproteobacteria bacterium]|nr:CHRD domain-containing protein [Gammaproteobacteria bacterium]
MIKALTANGTDNYKLDTTLTMDNLALLKADGMYLNVHSGTGGVIQLRGQILPAELKVYRAQLTAASSSVTTSASGVAAVTVNEKTGAFVTYVTLKNLTNTFSAAHIHNGTPTVATLAMDANNVNLLSTMNTFSATNLQALKDGLLYVNVHTQVNPTGEIKGVLQKE